MTSPESNREFIRKNWRAKARDTVWLVGDIAFAKDSHEFLKTLPGRKKFLAGNHDFENTSRSTAEEIMTAVSSLHAIVKKKYEALGNRKVWIQHTPLHPAELRGHLMMHGHIHDPAQDMQNQNSEHYNPSYINVNLDVLYVRRKVIMLALDELQGYLDTEWRH
ncbi:hypothetical protein AB4254_08295 [Vibrio breoganii]